MKPFKSSPNDIPPIVFVFKKFSLNNKSIIQKLFNISLLSLYFPTNWKIALLKILRTHNKHFLKLLPQKLPILYIQAEKFKNSFRGRLIRYDQSNCIAS